MAFEESSMVCNNLETSAEAILIMFPLKIFMGLIYKIHQIVEEIFVILTSRAVLRTPRVRITEIYRRDGWGRLHAFRIFDWKCLKIFIKVEELMRVCLRVLY